MTEDEIKALPVVLTPKQAAKILGIGNNKIYELIRAKQVPVLNLSERIIRIPKAELLKQIGL